MAKNASAVAYWYCGSALEFVARKISVVMTKMLAGVPKNRGDSNVSTPRMKLRMNALVMTGSIRMMVTRRKVCQRVAPDMRLVSSSDGSIARNASTISRNMKHVEYCIMC